MNAIQRFGIIPTISAAVVMSVIVISGCADGKGKHLGAEIPAQAPIVSLPDILKSPGEYNGKEVVMKGIVSGQCLSLCEFFFTDGIRKATI